MDRIPSPHINWLDPPEEREAAKHIYDQLSLLSFHLHNFDAAVRLVEHCSSLHAASLANDPRHMRMHERAALVDWNLIAGRDAALTVYHFQSVTRSVRDQLYRAPTLQAKTDTKALENAYERFKAEFPSYKAMRDAVGHWADMGFKPEDVAEHRNPAGPYIQTGWDPGTSSVVMTRNKEYVRLAVTQETAERLKSVAQDVFTAFRKADQTPPQFQIPRR